MKIPLTQVFICLTLGLVPFNLFAQNCMETEVSIQSQTQNWGDEMSWKLFDTNGILVGMFQGDADFTTYDTTLCLADGCYLLEATDSYGDGWNGGSIQINYDNETFDYTLSDGFDGVFYFGVNELDCTPFIPGCTDPMSLNYDPVATIDDGSCLTLQDVIAMQIIDTIQYTGIKDNRINWVIQNRGSSFANQAEFVQLYQDDLLRAFTLGDDNEIPPYAQYRNFFNLYAVWWPNAPSDLEWWSFSIIQQMRDEIFLPWANNETGWATWFSTTKNGGGGGAGLNRDMRVGDGKMFGMGYETFLHEFGHTMPGLLDEYSASGEWSGGQCWETGNTSGFTTKDNIPWRLWIEDDTPLPTPYTEEYLDKFGAFEGAMTNYFGCHRPTARGCFMGAGGFGEGYGESLCAVCQQRVICYLYKYVNVIEDFTPSQTTLDVTGNQSVHFSADVLKPEPNTQKYEWFLNGKLVAEGVEEIDLTFGPCEDYELIFAVTDTNSLVRYDPKFEDTYPKPYREVKWNINQTDVNAYNFDSDLIAQNPDCTGAENGSVEFTISGGIAPYSINYQGIEMSNPVSDLSEGEYDFEIVDANGCGITKSVTLTQDILLEPRICSEFTGGAWNLTLEAVNYDLNDLDILWSTGDQTPILIGLPDGNYSVEVSTASGCSIEKSISLNYVEVALEVEALVLASEIERNTGKIYLEIEGGLPPYSITWEEKTNRDITDTNIDNIEASGTTWGHLPEYAFDDDLNTKWLHFVSQNAWISYHFEEGAVVNYYTITSADDVPERDPKDWLFQGSNNGSTWTTLDQQSNQDFNTRFEKRAFLLTNSTSYNYYRLYITENHGDGSIQLQELEFIGTKNSDQFVLNNDAKDQARRINLAPGAYIYTIKDANLSVVKDTVAVGYAAGFEATDIVVVQNDDCSVKIENPNAVFDYYWLADEDATEILSIGNSFQPPASDNYFVAAVDPATQAMSSNRKGFAVTLEQTPLVEVTVDNTLAVVDPDPEMNYHWYSDASCENLLHTGNEFVPNLGTGIYYVAAKSNFPNPDPIDPATIPGIVIRMDASDLNGDGILDDPAPATSSILDWNFQNGNAWADGSWFAFRSNYQNGLGVADFATIWLQRIIESESGYQTILMAYEENPISFEETAPFEGLSANIPRHTDESQLFSNNTPATTLDGSTFFNGALVDPLTTANPLEFCILGTKMTAVSNSDIFYTDTKWEGKLGELILWDNALSDNQIMSISEYLRKKWISVADLESTKTSIFWEDPNSVTPLQESHISFFPNPSSQSIQLQGLEGNEKVQIFGVDGRLQHMFQTNAETLVIDIHNLPAGIHFLRVIDEKGAEVFQDKLVKL